jgi:hypothetical protein
MALSQATLTGSASAVYTSSGNSAVTTMYLCNYSVSDRTVTIYLVPSAGTAGNSNIIYKEVPIAAGDTYIIDTERLVLANGDSVQALASSTSSVTMTVSYVGV